MLNRDQIMQIIPHRPPMLLVDEITELQEDGATGILTLTGEEHFFDGHFPGNKVMPAVFQLEALAQVGAVAILSRPEFKGGTAYYTKIDKAKFRRMVYPGETIRLEIRMVKMRGPIVVAQGTVYVGEEKASEAEIQCAVQPGESHVS